MTKKPEFDAAAFVDLMAPVLGLTIEPEWRDGVIGYMNATATAAASVMEFTLDDSVEIAPTFKP